ncbi:MAG: low affinity iron permease family protein [bacterium]|nr:low affinity iron permease family protein [bacterium]
MKELFHRIAHRASNFFGSAWAFSVAVVVILLWFTTGPIFNFSNTWQLFINTFTTIMTFLMVFLIQNTQNRDAKATHLKLDELIKALRSARDKFIDLEDMSDEELDKLELEFKKVREKGWVKKVSK